MNTFYLCIIEVLNYQIGNKNKRLDKDFLEAADERGSVNRFSQYTR